MAQVAFHGLVFDDGYAIARAPGGVDLRFTRQERALLSQLAEHPGRLFTRQALYEALGSSGSDRNVDYVINRLRAKLGDTGAERRFISTQYGEGYVWVARPAELSDAGGFLVIGPVRGQDEGLATEVLAPLKDALQGRIGRERSVVLAPDWAPAGAPGLHFSLEVSFHRAAQRTHAAFVLRCEPTREMVASFRESFEGGCASAAMARLAVAVTDAAWKHLALGGRAAVAPSDAPLHLRMLGASALLDPPGVTWLANGEQLARLRAEAPDDPTLSIMWAMHLFAKSVLLPGPEMLTRQGLSAVEDEIEALTLAHVPAVRDDPILALASAKLLLLVNRGHADLAESLATRAFAGSTAFAAALPMLAQVHAYRGDLAEACRLYDEGLQFCEAGSEFEIYILVLKAMALIAGDDHAAVGPVLDRILQIQPGYRDVFGISFLPPGDDGLALQLAPLADRATLDYAQRVITYIWFRVADLFRTPAHSANIMRGPLTHLVRRLGPTVASDEIWAELPAELHYMRTARTPPA